MKLIVGLGNPGKDYEKTRHNVGFMVVDALASGAGLSWKGGFKGEVAKGNDILLLKPATFMNLSGESVIEALNFYKLDAKKDLWVVHDELDLSVGALRISLGAGSGGHNGIKSIIERLGHQDFARFRVGIGRPTDMTPVDDYVLGPLSKDKAMDDAIALCAKAVEKALADGIDAAMNAYNVSA